MPEVHHIGRKITPAYTVLAPLYHLQQDTNVQRSAQLSQCTARASQTKGGRSVSTTQGRDAGACWLSLPITPRMLCCAPPSPPHRLQNKDDGSGQPLPDLVKEVCVLP